jgi:antitoxin (DNA-binding transcriptional repressor) of toxin-antitoxin stability system
LDFAEVDDRTAPVKVGVREFRSSMTSYLHQARLGASFLITPHDQVIAELRPPPLATRPLRQPGALRGQIRMAPDFNALPGDILDAMEGGGV